MPNTSSNWRLSEQAVDRTKEHIELRFGDASSFPYMDAERTAERQRKGCGSRGRNTSAQGNEGGCREGTEWFSDRLLVKS